MSLSITSDAFIWSIRALLLVAVVAIVWGWPRLARRGILPILGRLVALTVVSGLGVINVLAPVNASYGWYLTVADLMPGAEDQRGTAVHQGSASSTAADPPVASAPIISGATLFLAVGGVMLVSGLAADRVRRLLTRRRGRGSGGPGTAGRSVGAARLGGNGSPGVSGASA